MHRSRLVDAALLCPLLAALSLAQVACDQDYETYPSEPIPDDDDDDDDDTGPTTSSSSGSTSTGDPTSTGSTTSTTTSSSDGGGPGNGGSGPGAGAGGGGENPGTTVGAGGAGACDGGGTELVLGAPSRLLLRGTIVTPAGPLEGEVLVDGNLITCVAASCAGEAGADGATILETNGYVLPGLIDLHNHVLFNIFDEDDWAPTQTYSNHNQWSANADYELVVDAKQELNGEGNDTYDLGCEMLKYGEMKALIAGTTSMQGSPGTAKSCFGSMIRSIDTETDLPVDHVQTATIFPSSDAADGVCTNFGDGDTESYIIHVGEGVDESARSEWDDLEVIGTSDGCLIAEQTTIVHGTAFTSAEIDAMSGADMGLVWSPKSNIFLYGAGTDTSQTTDIPAMLAAGINVSIGPDWSLGGSVNMLDELRYADFVDDAEWGDILDAQTLFEMATINPALALKYDQYIGTIEEGKRADLMVIRKDDLDDDPYETLLRTIPRDVTLVLVDGKVLYGDQALEPLGPAGNECETVDVCCAAKFACIAETGQANKLDQTFAQIETALEEALGEVADEYLPLAPIVRCPE